MVVFVGAPLGRKAVGEDAPLQRLLQPVRLVLFERVQLVEAAQEGR